MRLIDKDMLIEILGEMQGLCDTKAALIQNSKIWQQVKDLPAVDAVPVIRCKDCKFSKAYYHGSESNLGMFTYLCTQGLYGMNADDYCSRGERKEE